MISILKETIDQFISYAREQEPNEACGILISSWNQELIDNFIPIPNTTNQRDRFEFDAKVFILTLYQIEEKQWCWHGVIHSHPTSSAYPSSIDLHNWYYPEKSYWIYSLRDNRLNIFYIDKHKVRQHDYIIINKPWQRK
ncbi:M67 family metallopeptidase [Tepidibacillus infernus]|uniref:JAB domain-containing protein n=1 Tax=Tepidibacillus decaturensis TaxID=1413211 RepID=A0A135L5K1_9BACI|nr:M67 family metallopeptidase [Tepidibacillus decaturensis]KXG44231.1 hypothetical protein U473_09620 [Tepidibacillus decaturensis]